MDTASGDLEASSSRRITPNDFEGTDRERIQAAIDAASGTTNRVVIPAENDRGGDRWLIDGAILLPSGMSLVLEDCIIQLSDTCIDNIIRTDNVDVDTGEFEWSYDIRIIGIGSPVLMGADNPRSTGEGKLLSTTSTFDSPVGRGKMSYGTDAGVDGATQTGNWRNHGLLIAYVDRFEIRNVTIRNAHCWALTHERVINARISDIHIDNPPRITVDGETHYVANRDGINLRQGCKRFDITNVSGETGDDFIAMTLLAVNENTERPERLSASMLTTPTYEGPNDHIEDVTISNVRCRTKNHGVALRTIDEARIRRVFIDGLVALGNHDVPSHQTAILFGGRGYGESSPLGCISEVHAMNLMSDMRSGLIHVEAKIDNCTFLNGVYSGQAEHAIGYHDFDDATPKYAVSTGNSGRSEVGNVLEQNIVAAPTP